MEVRLLPGLLVLQLHPPPRQALQMWQYQQLTTHRQVLEAILGTQLLTATPLCSRTWATKEVLPSRHSGPTTPIRK
jgi:hypothetical protein